MAVLACHNLNWLCCFSLGRRHLRSSDESLLVLFFVRANCYGLWCRKEFPLFIICMTDSVPHQKNIDLVLQLARTPSSLDIYSKKCFGSESLTEMPGWLRQPLKCFLFCVTFVFTDNLIFKFISLSINNFVFGTVCLKWHCTTEHQPSSSA